MALLDIVVYPDECLQTASEPVQEVNDRVRKLIDDMAETMYAAPGIGLAANQVGINKRVIVVDVEYTDAAPNLIAMVNPEIVEREGKIVWEEGCLSFPSIYAKIRRAQSVVVEYMNENFEPLTLNCSDLTARIVQHELDHLENVLLVHRMSEADKIQNRKKLKELKASVTP